MWRISVWSITNQATTRVDARTFLDEDLNVLSASLLPHEFTHSWNGKYRRPLGLATTDFSQPMKGKLLWVYEGLTEYAQYDSGGAVWLMEPRSVPGKFSNDGGGNEYPSRSNVARLQATATAAQTLYGTTEAWDNWRRSVDYYPEGALLWLEADVLIRRLSNGKRSLNDFCARFLGRAAIRPRLLFVYIRVDGEGPERGGAVRLGKFFTDRLTSNAPVAPLGGIVDGGYRLDLPIHLTRFRVFPKPMSAASNAWYSLDSRQTTKACKMCCGLTADRAGLGPGMKLVEINGRKAPMNCFTTRLRMPRAATTPIEFIVENQGFFKVVKIDYHDGEKYPHVVRERKIPAILDEVTKPMVVKAKSVVAE